MNNKAAASAVQVLFAVNTSALIPMKLQANGNDIHITKADGTPLPYVIEQGPKPLDQSASTLIWTKLDNLPLGSSKLYFYYANPNASGESNGANVWVQNAFSDPGFAMSPSPWTIGKIAGGGCQGNDGWIAPDGTVASDADGKSARFSIAWPGGANGCQIWLEQGAAFNSGQYVLRFDWYLEKHTPAGPDPKLYVCTDENCNQQVYNRNTNGMPDGQWNFGEETTLISGAPSLYFEAGIGGGSAPQSVSGAVDSIRVRVDSPIQPAPAKPLVLDGIEETCP